MPNVIHAHGLPFCGLYLAPWKESQIVEGVEFEPSNGTIIVGEWGDRMPTESIIAHEWRHHWQWWNGWDYDGIGWDVNGDYDANIKDYFLRSKSEIDALRYEEKRASTEHGEWLLSICDHNQ